jgi:antitoxin PrlF
MVIGQSKVTSQGQISIPAGVRRKLGISAGSVLEWDEDGANVIVRRIGQYTSEDIHKAVFGRNASTKKDLDELKEGIRSHVKKRHARR